MWKWKWASLIYLSLVVVQAGRGDLSLSTLFDFAVVQVRRGDLNLAMIFDTSVGQSWHDNSRLLTTLAAKNLENEVEGEVLRESSVLTSLLLVHSWLLIVEAARY